jgi:hypothetical protein
MQPYRVILVKDDPSGTITLTMTLERSPDVGATIELPYGGTVVVRHIYSGHDGHGVIIAAAVVA